MSTLLSVVIPCYRSQDSIAGVIDDVERCVEAKGGYDLEIVCVDDCSPDETLSVLKSLAEVDGRIKVLSFGRNFGQHSALMAGYRASTGNIIVSMDDDGQNPPDQLFDLVSKVEEGYDVASARYAEKRHSLFRRVGSKFAMHMSHCLVGMPKGIELNSYCAASRYVVDSITSYTGPYPFVHGLMLQATRNVCNVDIAHRDRKHGKSGYSLSKLISLFSNGFTSFSEKPLVVFAAIGAILCGLGLGGMLISLLLAFAQHPTGLFAAAMLGIFLTGLVLVSNGIAGLYIGRTYLSINKLPQYVVRETVNIACSSRSNTNSKRHDPIG